MKVLSDEPALRALADALAAEIDVGGTPERLCARLAPILAASLRDDALAPIFAGRDRSFVAWHDPDHGLLLHGSVHAPGHHTHAHDHAEAWAVYGIYRGETAFRLFDRAGDIEPGRAALTLAQEHVATRGETSTVLPGQVHENWNSGTEVGWNLVVRPRPLGDVRRRRFDLTTGTYRPL